MRGETCNNIAQHFTPLMSGSTDRFLFHLYFFLSLLSNFLLCLGLSLFLVLGVGVICSAQIVHKLALAHASVSRVCSVSYGVHRSLCDVCMQTLPRCHLYSLWEWMKCIFIPSTCDSCEKGNCVHSAPAGEVKWCYLTRLLVEGYLSHVHCLIQLTLNCTSNCHLFSHRSPGSKLRGQEEKKTNSSAMRLTHATNTINRRNGLTD